MADNKEYTLSLILKVLTEGAKDILGIKKGIEGVDKAASKKAPDPTEKMRAGMKATSGVASELKATLGGLFSAAALTQFVRRSIQAVRQAQSAYNGLQSIAEASGVGIGRAFQEASRLAADGLLSVAETSRALQNLLSRGYNIEQAVQTINRLKDAAAFNRAANLSMGQAVVTATEGLKNENSILVDNAGVTKNVSILWKEYAEQIGKTVKQLTQQEKIQAEVNGILRETAAQAGNAGKAAAGLEGNFARLRVAQNQLSVAFGSGIVPALTKLLELGTRLIDEWVKPFVGGIEIMAIKTAAWVESIGAGAEETRRLNELADRMARDVVQRYEEGIIPAAQQATEANEDQARSQTATMEAAQLAAQRIAEVKQQTTEIIKAELAEQIRAEEAASKRLADIQKQRADVAKTFQDLIAQLQRPAAAAGDDHLGVLDIVRAIQAAQAALDKGDLQNALAQAERARDVIAEVAKEGAATNQYLTQQAQRAAELADKAGAGLEDAERAKVAAAQAQIRKLLGEAEALKQIEIGFDLEVAKAAADDVVAIIKERLAREAFPINVIPQLPSGSEKRADELLKNIPAKAGGGILRGIGTGTSDSNLYWGSRGEFVQPYKSVQRYGVHFMEAIRHGLLDPRSARAMLSAPRFAEGGLIAMNRLANQSPTPTAGPGGQPIHLHLNGREYQVSAAPDVAQDLTRAVQIEALKQGKRA